MNPDFRKVALIAASLGLLISLFFALRPDDDEEQAAQTTTAQTTTEPPPATTEEPPVTTEAPPPTTTQDPGTVHINYVIVGGKPEGGIARDSVARGRIVVINVTADVTDHVHVHGYDLMADVSPGAPATIRFTADAPGRFEIELEESGVQIAELEVRP
jgi:hemolysin activation/secretion protein